MDYLVGKLHEELGIVPYYHDSLLTDGVQRAFATYPGRMVSGAGGASCWTGWLGILALRDPFILEKCRGQGRFNGAFRTWHILQ